MKSFLHLLPAIGFLLFLQCTTTDNEPELNLVWADEFEISGMPNPDNWDYEQGFVRNNEHQWYQPDNAWVEDGKLIIEGRREQIENPNYNPDSDSWRSSREFAEYTSTSMRTRGKQSWQYGRFEMRAKIDTREGLWPAFWMLGIDGQWPRNGEIDIMEYYDGDLLANAAWGTEEQWVANWDDSRYPVSNFEEGWADEYHIWRMDWTEEQIRIYVDDLLLNEIDLSETINPDGTNPFHQPHYMIVNLAIGGNNGGDPSGTEFPSRYEIDYIRVYEFVDAAI
ncbi:MAG: glycoside hydrolase family 16 protein [Balneolaceae bacterium]